MFVFLRYIINSDVATMTFDKKSVDAASIDIYIASFSLRLDRVKYVDPTFSIGQSRYDFFYNLNCIHSLQSWIHCWLIIQNFSCKQIIN